MTSEPARTKLASTYQAPSGRIVVSPRSIRAFIGRYAVMLGVIAMLRQVGVTEWEPAYGAILPGLITVASFGPWSRSSARYRIARVVGLLLTMGVPIAAVLPLSHRARHGWYPAVPLELAGSFAAVALYVAITRLPGFTPPPPVPVPDAEGFVPRRAWTADERRHLIEGGPQVIFRHRRPMVFHLLVFGALTLLTLVLAGGGFVTGVWFGGLVAAVACVLSVRCAIRTLAIAVIVNADELTVRNVFRTHHIPWTEVRAIVAPDDDWFARLRIKRTGKRSIGCTAVTASAFRTSRGVRDTARQLTELFGPSLVVEASEQ